MLLLIYGLTRPQCLKHLSPSPLPSPPLQSTLYHVPQLNFFFLVLQPQMISYMYWFLCLLSALSSEPKFMMTEILLTVGLPSALHMFNKCVSKEFQQCQGRAVGCRGGLKGWWVNCRQSYFFYSVPRSTLLYLESQSYWMASFMQAAHIYDMLTMMQALYKVSVFLPGSLWFNNNTGWRPDSQMPWLSQKASAGDYESAGLPASCVQASFIHLFTHSAHLRAHYLVCSIISSVGIEVRQISHANHHVTKSLSNSGECFSERVDHMMWTLMVSQSSPGRKEQLQTQECKCIQEKVLVLRPWEQRVIIF